VIAGSIADDSLAIDAGAMAALRAEMGVSLKS
jgi:hypothetical protein